MVALEEQGRLRHVELGQQPAILGTDGSQGRARLPATALTNEKTDVGAMVPKPALPRGDAGLPQKLQWAVPV